MIKLKISFDEKSVLRCLILLLKLIITKMFFPFFQELEKERQRPYKQTVQCLRLWQDISNIFVGVVSRPTSEKNHLLLQKNKSLSRMKGLMRMEKLARYNFTLHHSARDGVGRVQPTTIPFAFALQLN